MRRLVRLARNRPLRRCVFLKRVADSVRVIIGNVIPDHTAQMNVIEDDQVIEKLPAATSDPAFRHSILPGACRAYASWFHAAGCQQIGHFLPKLAVAIQNHVVVSTRARKCLPQLLHYPGAGRVFRDIEMKDPASTVFDHKETIQDSEGESRHGEEVHGHDDIAVIAQERSPELAGLLAGIQAAEIPRNSAFRDIESELQKLTVNPQSALACILLYHPSDERSNLGIDSWPPKLLWP
jgi:hypothetical protein